MAVETKTSEALFEQVFADLVASYGGVMVSVGHRLGLYRALAGHGPVSPMELSARARLEERYVREWLNSQVAGGYLVYHGESDTYELPPEYAPVLADENSPSFLPPAFDVPASMWIDQERVLEVFRTGDGVPWDEHDDRLHRGVAGFYRNAYRAALMPEWLPALDGVVEKLKRGARVADIGCGHGHSSVLMASEFPRSKFVGFDTQARGRVRWRRVRRVRRSAAIGGAEADGNRTRPPRITRRTGFEESGAHRAPARL